MEQVPAMAMDIGVFVDAGILPEGAASTVVRRSIIGVSGGLELVREGAISRSELEAALPTLLPAPLPDNEAVTE